MFMFSLPLSFPTSTQSLGGEGLGQFQRTKEESWGEEQHVGETRSQKPSLKVGVGEDGKEEV